MKISTTKTTPTICRPAYSAAPTGAAPPGPPDRLLRHRRHLEAARARVGRGVVEDGDREGADRDLLASVAGRSGRRPGTGRRAARSGRGRRAGRRRRRPPGRPPARPRGPRPHRGGTAARRRPAARVQDRPEDRDRALLGRVVGGDDQRSVVTVSRSTSADEERDERDDARRASTSRASRGGRGAIRTRSPNSRRATMRAFGKSGSWRRAASIMRRARRRSGSAVAGRGGGIDRLGGRERRPRRRPDGRRAR